AGERRSWQFEGRDGQEGEGRQLVRAGQGPRIVFQERWRSVPRSVERLGGRILDGTVTIEKSPVTTRCAGNVVIRSDEMDNRAFDKKRSRGGIDGVVTIAMGGGAADNELQEAEKHAKYRVRVFESRKGKSMTMNRAYSVLEIKGVHDGTRTITGIASTASTD
ncbi:hypothetical protein VW29_17970, partial [Devosia limi DSM 17137]